MEFILNNEEVKVVGRVVIVKDQMKIGSEYYTFESHAICSPEDIFNEEEGIKVARDKNKRKMLKVLNGEYEKVVAEKQAKCDDLTRKIKKLVGARDRLEMAIEELGIDVEFIEDNIDSVIEDMLFHY